MIIELVGLPGTGKTTYTRALCNTERFTRVRVTNNRELLWYNFLFALRFPLTTLRLLGWLVRYRGPRALWYTKFTSIFLDYNAKYMKARRVQYAVLDQGHLQTFLSLFETPLPDTVRQRLLCILPKADHYVFFNLAEEIRLAQLGERGYTSRQGLMTKNEREVWQGTAAQHFTWLINATEKLAPSTTDLITETTKLSTWTEQYTKAHFIRYITFGRMPTEKAHGLQIATMCNEFQKLGHFVSLVTPKRRNPITASVTGYYQLTRPLSHHELAVPDIIGSTNRVTQLHHYLHEFFFAVAVLFTRLPKGVIVYTRTPLVAKVAAWRGRRVVGEQHYWPARGQQLTVWLWRGAKHLFANSDGTRDAMAACSLKATVAHNGFPAEWLAIDLSQAEAKQKLGLTTKLPIVMYVGSLGGWKGVDTLCEAGKLLKDQVQVVVIGGNETERTDWQKRYGETISLGSTPYHDLGWIQKAADVLVVPNNPASVASERYTSPIKLFAHLASGRPVIVSDLPTMRAIVDEQSVWFFEPGNAGSLSELVREILSATVDKNAITKHAYSIASEHTWSKRASKILSNIKIP